MPTRRRVRATTRGLEQQFATQCADAPNLAAYAAAAAADTFAPTWAWNNYGCADWPAAAAQDHYTGPWNRPTATTILLLADTGEPNTGGWVISRCPIGGSLAAIG